MKELLQAYVKNAKNREHYEKPTTEARSKCEEKDEYFRYNVRQT